MGCGNDFILRGIIMCISGVNRSSPFRSVIFVVNDHN